ncbi:MAG: hypothetical protein NT040_10475 [Bacteroidetes bacterium]|nr:hypothetical protein [Bacteroidota bacterium]
MYGNDPYVFLLGGWDLEMDEIASILISYGQKFHNLNLEWGAKLSAYQHLFNDKHTFVGIELARDIPQPKHYLEIDHHNEKSDLPSSLEQIAQLLNISLDRYQQLVAANDRGYIPAMLAMGASEEEVKEIREADRRAQGVTQEEEHLAQLAMDDGLNIGDLFVIYYEGQRFSSITDRSTSNHLLVWNHNTLCYYGNKTASLVDFFHPLISDNRAFCGGNPLSFFGLVKNCCSKSEIEEIKNEIIQLVNNN